MPFSPGISGHRFQAGEFSENRRSGNRTMMPGLPPVEQLTSNSTAKYLSPSQSHANQIVQQYLRKQKFQEMGERTQLQLLAEEFLPTWYIIDTSSCQRSGFQKDFWLAAGDSCIVREDATKEERYDLPCAHIVRSLGCDCLLSPRPGTYDLVSDNSFLHGNWWLQLELKATKETSLFYIFLASRKPCRVCWSTQLSHIPHLVLGEFQGEAGCMAHAHPSRPSDWEATERAQKPGRGRSFRAMPSRVCEISIITSYSAGRCKE